MKNLLLFEGKEKIKISEKSNQISLYNIEELKETYNKNQNNLNKVLDLSKTNDINEVIYKISKYEEINKELLSLKIEIEKEEKSIANIENELNIREKRIKRKACLYRYGRDRFIWPRRKTN